MGIRKRVLKRVSIHAFRLGNRDVMKWCSFEVTQRKRTRVMILGKNVGVLCHPNGFGTLVLAYRNRWTRWFQKSQVELSRHVGDFCRRNFSLQKPVFHKWERRGLKRRVKYSCVVR